MMLAFLLFRPWRGSEARPASVARNAAKILVQILVMWSIFFALLPLVVYYIEGAVGLSSIRFGSTIWLTVGMVVFVPGGALGVVSAVYIVAYGQGTPLPLDCPRVLVVRGPYLYVRNPMAVGSFAQGVAVGLMLGSPLVVAYALTGAVGWNYFVRPWEEMDLERRFGQPYARYRDSVRCWLLYVKRYRSR